MIVLDFIRQHMPVGWKHTPSGWISGNCPMCREVIIKPPKKKDIMPSETITAIVMNEYLATYNERENLNLPNYIRVSLGTEEENNYFLKLLKKFIS